MKKKQVIRLNESQLRRIVTESVKKVLNEEYGVDFEDTLAWVKKKKPDMPPEEQERFAKNIIKKREHDNMLFDVTTISGTNREMSWNEAKQFYVKKGRYIEDIVYKDKREGPYGEWHEFNPRYFFEED